MSDKKWYTLTFRVLSPNQVLKNCKCCGTIPFFNTTDLKYDQVVKTSHTLLLKPVVRYDIPFGVTNRIFCAVETESLLNTLSLSDRLTNLNKINVFVLKVKKNLTLTLENSPRLPKCLP